MYKVHRECLKITVTVLSLLHVAYECTCMPFNYPGSLLVIVWLLLALPKILGIKGNLTVLEGNNLQLTCEASGRPDPNITWTKEKPGNQTNIVVVQGKVLTITNINRSDAGNYTCAVYNGFGEPDNQTVYVNVPCEYALEKCLNNIKQRCTFLFFSVLLCTVLSITWINVWPSTSMQGFKLKYSNNHLLATFSFKVATVICHIYSCISRSFRTKNSAQKIKLDLYTSRTQRPDPSRARN